MTATALAASGQAEALRGLTDALVHQRTDSQGLLEAARDGDADAFRALVRRSERNVYHLLLRMVRRPSVAEDLSQDVFIRLWRHLPEVHSAEALPGWLRRVAVNACIDHWRKEEARRRRLAVLREHPVARRAVRPSGRMESREAMDIVQAALQHLPPALRSILILRAVEGLSYDELASCVGISISAVRSRLFRARHELYEALKRLQAPDYLARMYKSRQDKRSS